MVAGDASAAANLGDFYARGDAGTKDLPQAAEWYKVAATDGDISAASSLADLYAAGKGVRKIRYDHVPGATYTHPEIGSVGLSEAKAREKGHDVKVGKFPFSANSKATILAKATWAALEQE